MSTIKDLTYRSWRIIEGGDIPDDSRFRYKEVRDHVRSAIAFALKQNYFEQMNAGESRYGDDTLAKVYDSTIKTDPDTGIRFVEDPADSISVPASTRTTSIVDPNPYSIHATTYIPVRMEEVFVANLQPNIPCTVMYARMGDRFEFFNDQIEDGKRIKIIRKYSVTKDDEEDLNLPSEYELQIVNQVVQTLNPEIRQSDRQNDGVPIN